MTAGDEQARVVERYARRTGRYDSLSGWVFSTRAERERVYARILAKRFGTDVSGLCLLEVGCGHGDNLAFFCRMGFDTENLTGIELLQNRVDVARRNLPASVNIQCRDASALPVDTGSQDIVFQSLVFSSILDDGLSQEVAGEMWRVVRPGGLILWYDFTYSNPANADVRGVPKGTVRRLFPDARIRFKRVTLAPPLSRRLCAISTSLYSIANLLPFLRTHVVACIER